jgi:hypothetical protein
MRSIGSGQWSVVAASSGRDYYNSTRDACIA